MYMLKTRSLENTMLTGSTCATCLKKLYYEIGQPGFIIGYVTLFQSPVTV